MHAGGPCDCLATSIPNLGHLGEAPGDADADSVVPQLAADGPGNPKRRKIKILQKFCKQLSVKCDSISYSVTPDTEDDNGEAKIGFYGDVKHVIAGNAPADLLQKAIDARTFRYAFEAATVAPVGDDSAHGEMVAFNGVCYIRSTRLGTDEYYKTVSGTHMRCPAVGMVSPANAVPHARAATFHGGMTFTSAVNDIFATVKKGCDAPAVAFGGIVQFHKLVATAIARSTNEGEDIFKHKEKYYPFPPSVLFDKRCVVFGMVGDMDDAEKKGVKNLDRVLYKGASGTAGAGAATDLTLHAHVAVLHPACTARTAQEVRPEDVTDCYHLDFSSIVGHFELELWAIQSSLEEHPTVQGPTAIGQSLGTPVSPLRCNCSEWICNALADAGVTHVFGGHGGALAPLVNAVVRHPRLEWVVVRNEANASLMAAAYGKLTGKLGCCIATSGPGATNLTTGLFDAMLDQVAMIALTGLKPRAGMGYSEFQDFQQSRMFAAGGLPLSADVASPEALPPMLRDAVAKALTMRTCVHLGVPVDVQEAECPVPVKKFCAAGARSNISFPETHQFVLDNVATEIKLAAKRGHGRVLIAVGHRCVEAGAHILKLAERIHAPILTRLDAKGCCDESHPLVLGVSGVHGKPGLESAALLIETSELVLSFGNHDDTIVLCNRAGLQIRPMIQFECDAACVLANARFHALHTVVGDTAWAIDKLLERLDAIEPEPSLGSVEEWKLELDKSGLDTEAPMHPPGRSVTVPRTKRRPSRTTSEMLWEEMREGHWKKLKDDEDWAKFGRYEVVYKGDFKHCHPAAVLQEMSQHLGPNDVLSVDTGDVTLWAGLCAVLTQGQRTLSSERMGTMGYGLCAGIVASLIRGDTGRSVVVAGDGGIQMTINELGTVKQLFANSQTKHKLLVIVFDNERLSRVYFGFDGAMGCELGPSPDFVGVAKACGGDGATLSSPHELKRAMELAFASEGLFLLHVLVDPSVKADMATFKDKSTNMANSG